MKTRRKSQSEPVRRPLVAALRLFLALFLALCLVQQPAYAQAPIRSAAAGRFSANRLTAARNNPGRFAGRRLKRV